ncbi:3901_t:CDS:1, partial [Funneliformis geosporum]
MTFKMEPDININFPFQNISLFENVNESQLYDDKVISDIYVKEIVKSSDDKD